MAKAAVTGTLFFTGLVGVAALGALGVKPPDAVAGGSFEPGTNVGLDAAQLKQAARALTVVDNLKARPLATLSMVVSALQESMFRPVPNAHGSGYCGVFQADPANIPCGATEEQAKSFLKGGRGFQAGGAMHLARVHPGMSPGAIATAVEASGDPASVYDAHRSQADKIIAAWHQGALVSTVPFVPGDGSPKSIIDQVVLPMANAAGIKRTVAQNDAANAAHGGTIDGGLSDHQGPPEQRWAADMSNGVTTPQEDRLAAALAQTFGIPWHGSGLVSSTHDGYRFQLIYRTSEGGNHFNHVHFGVAKVQPVIWATPSAG